MRCPKCGRDVQEDAVICPACDFIMDTTFLGDDIRDDESVNRPGRSGRVEVESFDDAMILGDGTSDFGSIEATGAGATGQVAPAGRLYVSGPSQALLSPDAIPAVADGVDPKALHLTPFEEYLLGFVDGQAPVEMVKRRSRMDELDVKATLALLADKGIIRVAGRAFADPPKAGARKTKGAKPSGSHATKGKTSTSSTSAARLPARDSSPPSDSRGRQESSAPRKRPRAPGSSRSTAPVPAPAARAEPTVLVESPAPASVEEKPPASPPEPTRLVDLSVLARAERSASLPKGMPVARPSSEHEASVPAPVVTDSPASPVVTVEVEVPAVALPGGRAEAPEEALEEFEEVAEENVLESQEDWDQPDLDIPPSTELLPSMDVPPPGTDGALPPGEGASPSLPALPRVSLSSTFLPQPVEPISDPSGEGPPASWPGDASVPSPAREDSLPVATGVEVAEGVIRSGKVPHAMRTKASRIFEQALKDVESGNLGSARMNAKLAIIYDPEEPRYAKALDDWQKASAPSRPDKKSPEALLFEQAQLAEARGDFKQAVSLLEQAIAANPKLAVLHNRLGVILATRLKQLDQAVRSLEKAIELDGNSFTYKNNLGKVVGMLAAAEDRAPAPKRSLLGGKEEAAIVIKPHKFRAREL